MVDGMGVGVGGGLTSGGGVLVDMGLDSHDKPSQSMHQ